MRKRKTNLSQVDHDLINEVKQKPLSEFTYPDEVKLTTIEKAINETCKQPLIATDPNYLFSSLNTHQANVLLSEIRNEADCIKRQAVGMELIHEILKFDDCVVKSLLRNKQRVTGQLYQKEVVSFVLQSQTAGCDVVVTANHVLRYNNSPLKIVENREISMMNFGVITEQFQNDKVYELLMYASTESMDCEFDQFGKPILPAYI